MADTGHLVIGGFKAGAIEYVTLDGFVPNPSAETLVACVVSEGFGLTAFDDGRLLLDGFVTNPASPGGGGSGAFYVFGDAVVR